MTIVLPILFMAVGIGLYARRITAGTWVFLGVWIMAVILYQFFKAK